MDRAGTDQGKADYVTQSSDMIHRQVGNYPKYLCWPTLVADAIAQDQRLMADHGPFGSAGGARGINNKGGVVWHDCAFGRVVLCIRYLIGQVGKFLIRQRATTVTSAGDCDDPVGCESRVCGACQQTVVARLCQTEQHYRGCVS